MIEASSLDHVALWVGDREAPVQFMCDHLGMHVIEEGDDFTLIGVDAREGKLTLFEAAGERQRGVLGRIVLRVSGLSPALEALPAELDVEHDGSVAGFVVPGDLPMGLTERSGTDYDLDHVVLRVPDPSGVAATLADLGFERRNGSLEVADRRVVLAQGRPEPAPAPLLHHVAVLVDSAIDAGREAVSRGLTFDKVVDARNTIAVFVTGPEGIPIEYVEHKPGFTLE